MNSNYEIISKEIIKPSSQTPDHLKIFKLSYFDQFAPPVYVSSIFFYEADESRGLTTTSNHIQISQNLKKSLSETLTSFYPLAGRVHGSTVDCNDAGVEFIDTRVHSKLTESIHEPDVEHLKNLLPLDPAIVGCQGTLLLVQLNFFDCGGIALGICVSHQIADMSCIMAFVTAWVATHAGERKTSKVGFQLSTLFPAREIFSLPNTWETLIPVENLGTKMLVFTKEKLAALRRTVISSTGSTVEDPTRVELVSAFIWQHLSQFFKTHPQKGSFGAYHVVNLRARVGQKHQILENVFGNFVMPAFVFPKSNLNIVAEEFHESVRKFRNAIRSINGDISIDRESQDHMINDVLNLFTNKEIELYLLTSWCRFPIYEVDFGWGKPIWVCTSRGTVKNAIVLLDSKDGEGVETWLSNMDQDFLEILETQIKLI